MGKRSFFASTQHIKTIINLVPLGAESWLITLFKAVMLLYKHSLVTKKLRQKRWQMKRNGTDVQHIEYTEICKAIRSRMSEDINNYNEEQLIKSLKDNKGKKKIKRKQCLGRRNIISLKEENGTHIHHRDRMIKRCEEFYTNLYSTKLLQGQPSV